MEVKVIFNCSVNRIGKNSTEVKTRPFLKYSNDSISPKNLELAL